MLLMALRDFRQNFIPGTSGRGWPCFRIQSSFRNIYEVSILKNQHHTLLNDFTFWKNDDSNTYFLKKKLGFINFKKIIETFIHPTSNWRLLWDFIQIFLNLVFFVEIPLSIGFENELFQIIFPVKMISLFLFAMDFLVNFNTAYYFKGELIISKTAIIKNYFHGKFLQDCLSLSFLVFNGIFQISTQHSLMKFIAFLFILRINFILFCF